MEDQGATGGAGENQNQPSNDEVARTEVKYPYQMYLPPNLDVTNYGLDISEDESSDSREEHSSLSPTTPNPKTDIRPRGPMTAFAFFVKTFREETKEKNPDEIINFVEFSKECAQRWTAMTEEEKQRFQEMAEEDKKRYELEMQSYVPPKRKRKYQDISEEDKERYNRELSARMLTTDTFDYYAHNYGQTSPSDDVTARVANLQTADENKPE